MTQGGERRSATRVPAGFAIRSDLRPGDAETIVRMHGDIYAREHGFDRSFEEYVAGPLTRCIASPSSRERIWIAERDGRFAGCVAIVAADAEDAAASTRLGDSPLEDGDSPLTIAQLRWFLVAPESRGSGLGRALLEETVRFSGDAGYRSILLWTVSSLTSAARLYRAVGFRRVEEKPGHHWGVDVIEERYDLALDEGRLSPSAGRPSRVSP